MAAAATTAPVGGKGWSGPAAGTVAGAAPAEIEVIVVDDSPETPVFPPAQEVVMGKMPLETSGDGVELQLLLQQETCRVSVVGGSINLRNLMGRALLDLPGVYFDPKKIEQGYLQVSLGPYTCRLYKVGFIEIMGKMHDPRMAQAVANKLAECCRRADTPIRLEGDLQTTSVKGTANVGRSIILPTLSKHPGASPVSGSGSARFVELTIEGGGKVMVFNTGKITVTAPSRALARRSFMDAVAKVRTCMAIQVGSLKRPATSPIATNNAKVARVTAASNALPGSTSMQVEPSASQTEVVGSGAVAEADDSDEEEDEGELVDA
eukprot:m.166154 g.166154  ORF g.166154 m.166154 type:complete len:321 (+) comp14700_c0_seq2:115-1077(+)